MKRTFSWLPGWRRLSVCYERRAVLLQGLLQLACAVICVRFLTSGVAPLIRRHRHRVVSREPQDDRFYLFS